MDTRQLMVTASAGGREYQLVLDTNALCAIEEAADQPWTAFAKQLEGGRVGAAVTLVWGMTRKHHPELTRADAGEMVDALGGVAGLSVLLEEQAPTGAPVAKPRKARHGRR